MKDATRKRRTGGKSVHKGYKVEDRTKITDFKSFLRSTIRKDNLTLYLANVLVKDTKIPVVTDTFLSIDKSTTISRSSYHSQFS